MKIEKGTEWFNVYDQADMEFVMISMMDDSEYEYTRYGLGVKDGRVFGVCLDDIGEQWVEVEYCDNVKSVEELLKIGIECGVFVEIDYGYNDKDKYRVVLYPEEGADDKFKELAGLKSIGAYYSFI
jgi:hypothetical protein